MDYNGLSEEELIQLLSSLGGATGGGLPGKTPAAQLNYYQDLTSTLGFDPVQQTGLGPDAGPDIPEYVAPVNKQRFVYESDPLYKKMFDLVDQGASPATAVKTAGIKDPTQAAEAQKVVTDYAGSVVDEMNSRSKFDQANQKTAAKYTAPDGSKYKNAPLGGNDIYGTASEFDLQGQPTVTDLVGQLASVKGFEPQAGFANFGPQQRSAPASYTTGGKPASEGQSGRPVLYDSVNGQENTDNSMWQPPSKPVTKAVTGKTASGGGGERSWEAPAGKATSYVGGDSVSDAAYRNALATKIDKSKTTQVRSDANTNAMRRILALRTVLGG